MHCAVYYYTPIHRWIQIHNTKFIVKVNLNPLFTKTSHTYTHIHCAYSKHLCVRANLLRRLIPFSGLGLYIETKMNWSLNADVSKYNRKKNNNCSAEVNINIDSKRKFSNEIAKYQYTVCYFDGLKTVLPSIFLNMLSW